METKKHYFEDYIKHHVNEATIELIDWLYNLIGEEALPDNIFETPPNLAQDIVIHLLTALNSIIWEGVKLEATNSLNNLALVDYAQSQVDDFSPTVELESGYFEMNNMLDVFFEVEDILENKAATCVDDLMSEVINMWLEEHELEFDEDCDDE